MWPWNGFLSADDFTPAQIMRIEAEDIKIPDYTWHHNPINNTMQLVPFIVHDSVKRIGERALSEGR